MTSSHGPRIADFLSLGEAQNQIHSWEDKRHLVSDNPYRQEDIERKEKGAGPKRRRGSHGRNWIHHGEGEDDGHSHGRSCRGRSFVGGSLGRWDCGNDYEGGGRWLHSGMLD